MASLELKRPGRFFPCHTGGLAATEPLQFSSDQPDHVTWQKRPGRFSARLAIASKCCVRNELEQEVLLSIGLYFTVKRLIFNNPQQTQSSDDSLALSLMFP